MKPAKNNIKDRGESTFLMEPMSIGQASPHMPKLLDLAMELAAASSGLARSLPHDIQTGVAELVRSMNCYYSNLIEGHHTHPIDIERALAGEYSSDSEKRDLQLEARAHIGVQKWLDENGNERDPTSTESLLELHRQFYESVPDSLRQTLDPETGESAQVEPGNIRSMDVKVGHHVAISAGAINRFLDRYQSAYSTLGPSHRLVAVAAAHHRLLWIHPFLDGNGRVARLATQWQLNQLLETGSIWSVSRGFARDQNTYKSHLMACDGPRRGDLDGRGNLSEAALARFTEYFLTICLDQVRFMESLIEPTQLRERILFWTERGIQSGKLPSKANHLMDALLFRGSLPRGEVANLLGISDRHARRLTSALIEAGALSSSSHRAPLKLTFQAKLAPHWMPGLFPPGD